MTLFYSKCQIFDRHTLQVHLIVYIPLVETTDVVKLRRNRTGTRFCRFCRATGVAGKLNAASSCSSSRTGDPKSQNCMLILSIFQDSEPFNDMECRMVISKNVKHNEGVHGMIQLTLYCTRQSSRCRWYLKRGIVVFSNWRP